MPSREQYKILALKDRIGKLVADYEEQIANLRVDLTVQDEQIQANNQQLENARREIQELRDQFANSAAGEEVVVNGEVVDVQEEIQ